MSLKVPARLSSKQHVSTDPEKWSLNFVFEDGTATTMTVFVSKEDAEKYDVDTVYNVTVTAQQK